jgi:ABC-type antimicrobial peptide transport system permease subunit
LIFFLPKVSIAVGNSNFTGLMFLVIGLLFSLISALIASYLPARSAGKLTPIEIIRAGTE